MTPLSRSKAAVDVIRALAREPVRTLRLLNKLPFALRGLLLTDAWRNEPTGAVPAAAEQHGPLRRHFEAHREGPGIWKWLHYFELYERHLQRFVGRPVNVLEIGVFSGGSLGMWHEYFGAGCTVYGVDIEPACRAYAGERTKVLIGDQGDRDFWRRVRAEVPRFDVVIDDGGHTPEQQIVTLEEVLPYMSPGGVYVCEDVVGDNNGFGTYTRTLASELNTARSMNRTEQTGELWIPPTPFQADIHSIHFYPLVCVIEKHRVPVERFAAPRHGTTWEPFL